AFKPKSDDVRDAPALAVAARLIDAGASVVGTDPQALETARRALPGLELAETPAAAVAGADIVLLLTEWKEYRDLAPAELAAARGRILLDGRNCVKREIWRESGWTVRSLGRPDVAIPRSTRLSEQLAPAN
ncbi:MAG: UDPglucose 6-dehydrogenase, partial [Actinomycetota bacterium]|nr:UDPglucose 6-dehydrogenase [Actinomycetota bacterium]